MDKKSEKMIQQKKKKVAHILKSSVYSGAERVVFTIIRELKNQYDFIYIATDGPIKEMLEKEQIPYILLPEFNVKHLKKALNESSVDLVHAHDFSASILSILSGQRRLISHLHYDPPWARTWNMRTLAYALLAKRISRIIAVSDGAFQNLVFAKKFKSKTEIVHNPIDKAYIKAAAVAEQKEQCDLLFVGRLVEQKNPQMFIELVELLKRAGCELHCAMLGSGMLQAECQTLIKQKHLENNVMLLGFQDNPYAYMKNAKILCMTSSWEGYGLVAAEANILGVPVLTTKTGGTVELFGAESEVFCNNANEFSEKIQNLLKNEVMYQTWQRQALKRAEQFQTPEAYAKKVNLLYQEEMNKNEYA